MSIFSHLVNILTIRDRYRCNEIVKRAIFVFALGAELQGGVSIPPLRCTKLRWTKGGRRTV